MPIRRKEAIMSKTNSNPTPEIKFDFSDLGDFKRTDADKEQAIFLPQVGIYPNCTIVPFDKIETQSETVSEFTYGDTEQLVAVRSLNSNDKPFITIHIKFPDGNTMPMSTYSDAMWLRGIIEQYPAIDNNVKLIDIINYFAHKQYPLTVHISKQEGYSNYNKGFMPAISQTTTVTSDTASAIKNMMKNIKA